jgi:hypothetical protein
LKIEEIYTSNSFYFITLALAHSKKYITGVQPLCPIDHLVAEQLPSFRELRFSGDSLRSTTWRIGT